MANQQQIRKLLQTHPEGLTAKQIADLLGADLTNTHGQLKRMVDAYIFMWTPGRPRALWAVAKIPADCPRPTKTKAAIEGYLR